MVKSKYSKEIFVQKVDDLDGECLLAWDKVEDADDGEIAIYALVRVIKKKTETKTILYKG